MHTTRRFSALLIVLVAVTAIAPAALAGSQYMYKSSERAAQTWWTQIDDIPAGTSPLGNVHIGSLYTFETSKGKADAYAYIEDWDCEPGEVPGGGGHGEEPPENACDSLGSRFGEGFGLSFTMDNKLDSARLVGQLTVYGGGHEGGGVIGRPMADVTWTGVGAVFESSSVWRFRSGGTSYSDRYSSSDRNATMSGNIGPMGFDPDLSGGYMSEFKSMSKGRTK